MELSNSTVTCNTTKTHIHLHKSVLHFTVTHNLQQNDEHKIDVKFKKKKKNPKSVYCYSVTRQRITQRGHSTGHRHDAGRDETHTELGKG